MVLLHIEWLSCAICFIQTSDATYSWIWFIPWLLYPIIGNVFIYLIILNIIIIIIIMHVYFYLLLYNLSLNKYIWERKKKQKHLHYTTYTYYLYIHNIVIIFSQVEYIIKKYINAVYFNIILFANCH